MGNGISGLGGGMPPQGVGGLGDGVDGAGQDNPSSFELTEMMTERLLNQIVGGQEGGRAYIAPDPGRGDVLALRMVPEGDDPPDGAIVLDDVQTIFEGNGIVVDGDTQYVLTNQFTGCSFFMLDLGGTEHVFHVNEARRDQGMLDRLQPYMMVADSIRAGAPVAGEGRDAYFMGMVDGYLERHPQEAVTALRDDQDAYIRHGLALMAMENLDSLTGYAFTESVYTAGRPYDTIEDPIGEGTLHGSAMLVREGGGRWSMIEQSVRFRTDMDSGQYILDVERGGHHPLFTPNAYTVLEGLAGMGAVPPGGDLV